MEVGGWRERERERERLEKAAERGALRETRSAI